MQDFADTDGSEEDEYDDEHADVYRPTGEEIRAECEKLREKWPKWRLEEYEPPPVEIKQVRGVDDPEDC